MKRTLFVYEPDSSKASSKDVALLPEEILVEAKQMGGYSFASEGGWSVALDTTLTPTLEDEGWVRDLVRGVQQARKDADFQVSDRIAILVVEPSDESRFAAVFGRVWRLPATRNIGGRTAVG